MTIGVIFKSHIYLNYNDKQIFSDKFLYKMLVISHLSHIQTAHLPKYNFRRMMQKIPDDRSMGAYMINSFIFCVRDSMSCI